MKASSVVAWVPVDPSVRVMARATAEAAERGAGLRVLSHAPRPPQWSSWCAAARNLGVSATWTVVSDRGHDGGLPVALLAELAQADLIVTDAEALRGGRGASQVASTLARHADVYVVANGEGSSRARTRPPEVVVGVPDVPDHGHLLVVASREAEHRHRNLVLVHAQDSSVAGRDHHLEHRWLEALPLVRQPASKPVPARVVLTRRTVLAALRDHVDSEDVLVVGVHPPRHGQQDHLLPLLEAPPCDLLLTHVTSTVPDSPEPLPPPRALTSVRAVEG